MCVDQVRAALRRTTAKVVLLPMANPLPSDDNSGLLWYALDDVGETVVGWPHRKEEEL
jgi:hypothetical protein